MLQRSRVCAQPASTAAIVVVPERLHDVALSLRLEPSVTADAVIDHSSACGRSVPGDVVGLLRVLAVAAVLHGGRVRPAGVLAHQRGACAKEYGDEGRSPSTARICILLCVLLHCVRVSSTY